MSKISVNLTQVRTQVQEMAAQRGGKGDNIHILAVSKTQSAKTIRETYTYGQWQFGENYLQEALDKQEKLRDLDIEWHFIGPIQSNKTRQIAEHFAWVHSLDRLKIAQRLDQQRPPQAPPLNVCLQVNIDAEAQKAGLLEADVLPLAKQVRELKQLRLRGLMAIPKTQSTNPSAAFARMYTLFDNIRSHIQLPNFDTLSMGMSNDLEAAIGNGANMVRVGTAIFGPRTDTIT